MLRRGIYGPRETARRSATPCHRGKTSQRADMAAAENSSRSWYVLLKWRAAVKRTSAVTHSVCRAATMYRLTPQTPHVEAEQRGRPPARFFSRSCFACRRAKNAARRRRQRRAASQMLILVLHADAASCRTPSDTMSPSRGSKRGSGAANYISVTPGVKTYVTA